MLPTICIALVVLRLGHATSGIRAFCDLRQRLVATWAEFQHSVVYCATDQWKHVLIQKVFTLNTWWDVACLTFQLPHVTTGSFQSYRWQPRTSSIKSFQRLKERNKPSVWWKSFAIHKLVCWHFQVGWASRMPFVFFWDNVNTQKYVWIILFRMTFFGFPKAMTGDVDNL